MKLWTMGNLYMKYVVYEPWAMSMWNTQLWTMVNANVKYTVMNNGYILCKIIFCYEKLPIFFVNYNRYDTNMEAVFGKNPRCLPYCQRLFLQLKGCNSSCTEAILSQLMIGASWIGTHHTMGTGNFFTVQLVVQEKFKHSS